MGGTSGTILILLILGGGAYAWCRFGRPQQTKQQETNPDGTPKTWRDKLPKWGSSSSGEKNLHQNGKDVDDDGNDVFHDEEAGSSTNSSIPKKSWMDTFADKLSEIEIPSTNKIRMMVMKQGLSSAI